MGDTKENTLYYLTFPLKRCSPLLHKKFRWLYKWPVFHFFFFRHCSFLYWFYVL